MGEIAWKVKKIYSCNMQIKKVNKKCYGNVIFFANYVVYRKIDGIPGSRGVRKLNYYGIKYMGSHGIPCIIMRTVLVDIPAFFAGIPSSCTSNYTSSNYSWQYDYVLSEWTFRYSKELSMFLYDNTWRIRGNFRIAFVRSVYSWYTW